MFAHAVAQAVTAAGRDDMLPVLTGVRIEIDGLDRSRLLATDRFRLSHRELTWSPHTPDESVAALVPAKVLGDTAKSLTAGSRGHHRAVATAGAGEGLIGFEGHAAGRRTPDHHPAARRRVPQGPQPVPGRAPDHRPGRQGRPGRVGQAGRHWSPSATPRSSWPSATACSPSTPAPATRRRPSESIEATVDGEDITTGFNPQFLLDGLTAIDEPVVELAFTQASKPVVISGTSAARMATTPAFRYLLMPRRLLS